MQSVRIAVLLTLTAVLSSSCSDSPTTPTSRSSTLLSTTSLASASVPIDTPPAPPRQEPGPATVVAELNPDTAPALMSMWPAAGTPGRSARVTFTGRGFTSEGTIVNVGGGGIRIELPFLEVTEQSLTVWFAIYADAIPGQRFISLTTAAGTTSALPFTIGAPLPAIGSFAANPRIINVAASSTLSWTGITNATRCSINNGVGDVPCGNSSVVVSPQATTEYMLSAVGPGGREWTYQTVAVEPGRTTYSQAFAFTGASQTFTVPEGVTSITIEASGAQGGTGLSSGLAGGAAGLGSTTRATLSVTPGAVYQVNVGGQGTNGTAGVGGGGAGGGASDVRTGGNTLNDRVIVAGGGGGGGLGSGGFGTGGAGGDGGGLTGASGNDTSTGAGGGGGGTQGAGGSGGGGGSAGAAGTVGQGGLAGGTSGNTAGGFNGGGNGRVAGGGGGGYYGGGGGGQANTGAGGGGGSSFAISSATNVTHQRGGRAGNGVVTISWQ